MYLKLYLSLLSISILCLILLTHLHQSNYYRNDRSFIDSLILNGSSSFHFLQKVVLLGQSESQMGDSRKSSKKQRNGSMKEEEVPGVEPVLDGKNADEVDGRFAGHFDILKLNQHLKLCVRESDSQIDMDEYIFTFQQLYKFFCLLGTVFGFVGSDVKSKLEILQDYRNGENKTEYETIEKMLEFEKNTDFLNKNKESSGSRTLLRLHRALNFVSKFLGKVETIGESDGTYHICKEAYSETLSKFHPWLIQKGAGLAMLALPLKKDLMNKVCDGRIETSEVVKVLHEVINSTEKVYNQCEEAYREAELLNLP